MACSECGRMGHKKPNCPIIEEKKEIQTDRLISVLQTVLPTIPLILSNPLFIAFIWFKLSKMNPSINALNSVIAIGELVPTIDIGLPEGVVLGAMVEKVDDVVEYWNENSLGSYIEKVEEGLETAKGGLDFILDLFRPSTWESVKEFGK